MTKPTANGESQIEGVKELRGDGQPAIDTSRDTIRALRSQCGYVRDAPASNQKRLQPSPRATKQDSRSAPTRSQGADTRGTTDSDGQAAERSFHAGYHPEASDSLRRRTRKSRNSGQSRPCSCSGIRSWFSTKKSVAWYLRRGLGPLSAHAQILPSSSSFDILSRQGYTTWLIPIDPSSGRWPSLV